MLLTSPLRRFLDNHVYAIPEPPPQKRTKPLEVICVGPPRSGTESLQSALLMLGYDHTYHGWDVLFEQPNRCQAWTRLGRRKWLNEAPGLPIAAAEFDELLGHSVAITDIAASCFAADLIRAFPDAKVVLNTRRDLDAWMRSMERSFLQKSRSWVFVVLPWFDRRAWWLTNVCIEVVWPGLFRCINSRESFTEGVEARGKLVYEEHCNMIRGLVPPERLLEWSVEDGWEPLCEFLGKEVPSEPFPHVNTSSVGWKEREVQLGAEIFAPAMRRLGITLAVTLGAMVSVGVAVYRRR